MKKLKLYFDNCCFNRPFDYCSNDRVYFEAEAVLSILRRCMEGKFEIVGSDVLEFEISNMLNEEKKQKVLDLYSIVKIKYSENEKAKNLSDELMNCNIKWMDSLHIAIAETNNVDIFLTTDDKLITNVSKINLRMVILNPLKWFTEVVDYE